MGERLEDACIGAFRQRLLTADAETMGKMWKETNTVKGGTERTVFNSDLKREIVGQAVANYVSYAGGHIYGSWPRTRNNGKPWRDLDISMPRLHRHLHQHSPDKTPVEEFVNGIVPFISFIVDALNVRNVEVSEIEASSTYALKTFVFSVFLSEDSFDLRCDISSLTVFKRPGDFTPPTLGSCLKWSVGGGFEIRDCLGRRFCQLTVDDIRKLLREGKDIKIVSFVNYVEPFKRKYAIYYWQRITQMEKDGICLNWRRADGWGEPKRLTSSELDEAVKAVSSVRIG